MAAVKITILAGGGVVELEVKGSFEDALAAVKKTKAFLYNPVDRVWVIKDLDTLTLDNPKFLDWLKRHVHMDQLRRAVARHIGLNIYSPKYKMWEENHKIWTKEELDAAWDAAYGSKTEAPAETEAPADGVYRSEIRSEPRIEDAGWETIEISEWEVSYWVVRGGKAVARISENHWGDWTCERFDAPRDVPADAKPIPVMPALPRGADDGRLNVQAWYESLLYDLRYTK